MKIKIGKTIAQRNLPELTPGWYRVQIPREPHPWTETIQGIAEDDTRVMKIKRWLHATWPHVDCRMTRYDVWDFEDQETATAFALTWG